jgi:hypothetical protein
MRRWRKEDERVEKERREEEAGRIRGWIKEDERMEKGR